MRRPVRSLLIPTVDFCQLPQSVFICVLFEILRHYSEVILMCNSMPYLWPHLSSSPYVISQEVCVCVCVCVSVCVCKMGVVRGSCHSPNMNTCWRHQIPSLSPSPLSVDYHDNTHSYHGCRLIIQLHTVNYHWTGRIVLGRRGFFFFFLLLKEEAVQVVI